MKYDIAVMGGGPAGLSFAQALSDTTLKIAVIEKQTSKVLSMPPDDGREIALTHHAQKILINLGIWDAIDKKIISLIKEAKVLNGTSPYSLHFNHQDTVENTLGYLVPNNLIRAAAYKKVKESSNINVMSDVVVESFTTDINSVQLQLSNQKKLEADLLIAADGRLTNTRRQMGIPTEVKDFGKTCIVCKMKHDKPHNHLAYECFHYGRTLAVLPMAGNYSSIVITISSEKAESIMQMDDQDFNQDIASRFNHRFGEMQLEGERHAYPLIAVHANYFHSTRFALIGDASVGMHPVTAHGFNLGLRGAQILADLIKDALSRNLDIASVNVLKQYNQKHQRNTRPLYHGTNLIVDLYNSEKISAKVIRRAALRFGNNFTPIKKIIMNQLTEAH